MVTRRQSVKRIVGIAVATAAAPMLNRGWFQLFAQSNTKYSTRAIDLLQRSTTVDMLNPFTLIGVLAPLKGDKRPTWFTNPETFTAAKSDEAIRKMAEKGGVMGITEVRNFVAPKEPTTIENLLDHYDHVAKLVGVEHVGVASDIDLDGYDALPDDYKKWLRGLFKSSYAFRDKMDTDGVNHYKRMFDLTDGLIRRRYSDADIELVLGGNFRRVLEKIWSSKG
ncbi:MAG TPA: membrane dipeptidase [Chthoniobacterales bacterium]|nr:membrane dipeptidase [Chthoniobacterales bacterium]